MGLRCKVLPRQFAEVIEALAATLLRIRKSVADVLLRYLLHTVSYATMLRKYQSS